MKKILNRCTDAYYESEFIFDHDDNQTRNFIDYHIVFHEFYRKHQTQAYREGYTIIKKRDGTLGKEQQK